MAGQKYTVNVSKHSYELVQDLEAALCRLGHAEGTEPIHDAYAALCQRRKELFQYLETLETEIHGHHRSLRSLAVLRFD